MNLVSLPCRKRSVAEFMQEPIAFLVRVQCRRKESSRSCHSLYSITCLALLLTVLAKRVGRTRTNYPPKSNFVVFVIF